jgi:hypothetical protein
MGRRYAPSLIPVAHGYSLVVLLSGHTSLFTFFFGLVWNFRKDGFEHNQVLAPI